jgi:FdhD protein
MTGFDPIQPTQRARWTAQDGFQNGTRDLPEEMPIALVHDGSTTAVMMGTPQDLEDFAVGFSLSEGLIQTAEEIRSLEIVRSDLGAEVRMWMTGARTQQLAARRRRLAGPTGCGLCGIESLEEVRRPTTTPGYELAVTPFDIFDALAALEYGQRFGQRTRAIHAAALWSRSQPILVREDVGRHNALDKLIGAAHRTKGANGILVLTSRVSIEMVQKAAALGVSIVCAMSAPTSLAVRLADEAGITLVAIARADGFEVFTHARRVLAR